MEHSCLRLCLACKNMEQAEEVRSGLLASHTDACVDLVHLDVGSVQAVLAAAKDIKTRLEH